MLVGKSLWLAKRPAKRLGFAVLCCLLLVPIFAGFTFSAPTDLTPELAILGLNVQTYDLDALQWDFPFTLVGFGFGEQTARLSGFTINGYNMLQNVPVAQRTMLVHRLDGEIGRAAFRAWNNYRQRAATLRVRNDERMSLSASETHDFRQGNAHMRGVMRRRGELAPVLLSVNVSELPFEVAADGHYRVRAVVDRGGTSITWEGEVLIVDVEPIVTNPVWTPADLHLHSAFALDGRFEPRELAPMLANRGYAIGYITDEPVGQYITTRPLAPRMSGTGRPGVWDPNALPEEGTNLWLIEAFPGSHNRAQHLPWLATWEAYRDAVRAASTAQVAMFPGVEVAASTRNETHTSHNGHALAYGIQNLIGVGAAPSFDTTGMRYNWFEPNRLLSHINSNNAGLSSVSIAHPTPDLGFPWNVWSPVLAGRYDGFELMSGIQTQFGPNSSPMRKWREEIVARLGQVFVGMGLPSARTGSDWGGSGSHLFNISYFTFIGLPSRPSDMRHLAQNDVDAALRAGRTVASRLGGFATLRLRNAQGVLQEVGSRFTLPVNATVSGEIVLRAARSGSYWVRIVDNSSGRTGLDDIRHGSWHALTSGQTAVIPVSFRFEGGQRAYHVVVEHVGTEAEAADTIYTTPIFIQQ